MLPLPQKYSFHQSLKQFLASRLFEVKWSGEKKFYASMLVLQIRSSFEETFATFSLDILARNRSSQDLKWVKLASGTNFQQKFPSN